jgi:outer membrane protein TolC
MVPFLIGPTAADAEIWPLSRVLEVVREHDAGVRAARAAGDAGRARAAQNWALLLPHVALSTGFTRSDDPALLFSQKLWQGRFTAEDFALDQLNQPAPQSALQWGLSLDQPLWNGGREWLAPAQAGRYGRAASAMEQAAVADRLLAAVEAWVDAVGARARDRAAREALTSAEMMRSAAIGRLRMGQVAEVDTLRAAARAGEARVRAIGAARTLAVQIQRLSGLVGTTIAPEDLDVSTEAPDTTMSGTGVRGELLAAREAAKAASTQSREAGMALLPSINTHFAYTQYRPAGGDGGWEPRWLVAVSADLPLFDGTQRLNEWRVSKARAAEAEAQAEALERDLAVALASARAEATVAIEQREAARDGRLASEAALRLAQARYGAGLLALSDLLAADAEATAARATEIDAATAIVRSHYRLLHALGELR